MRSSFLATGWAVGTLFFCACDSARVPIGSPNIEVNPNIESSPTVNVNLPGATGEDCGGTGQACAAHGECCGGFFCNDGGSCEAVNSARGDFSTYFSVTSRQIHAPAPGSDWVCTCNREGDSHCELSMGTVRVTLVGDMLTFYAGDATRLPESVREAMDTPIRVLIDANGDFVGPMPMPRIAEECGAPHGTMTGNFDRNATPRTITVQAEGGDACCVLMATLTLTDVGANFIASGGGSSSSNSNANANANDNINDILNSNVNDNVSESSGCLTADDCVRGLACQTAACWDDGSCVYTNACDMDHCVNGACAECIDDYECDDNNACTDDTCTANACESTANTAACDDGDACTDEDVCDGRTCAGTAVDCGDGDLCTQDVCTDGSCSNPSVECAAGTECDGATGDCVAAAADDFAGFAVDGTGADVDFAALEVGDTITLTAPLPEAAAPRQVVTCNDCVWNVDPAVAGTFNATDECVTEFTVNTAGDFTISVAVTCDDGRETTFNQAGTASEAPMNSGITGSPPV